MAFNNLSKRFAVLTIAASTGVVAFAQSITGTVKDNLGEPVIGASVQVKGTQLGAVTDLDGKFTINGAKSGQTIVVSYVGYQTENVKLSSGHNYNIVLKDDNLALEELVVVGYGTMRRKDLTGAVASVTGEKLTKNPVANIAEALQGQMPGVNIISQDGRPGGAMSIRVRGGGSITQSNDPLMIVDGVPVSRIDDIPADNIESIDVLKDAASTAIYGARGANGVILITTKTAKEGKAQVKYNVYYQYKEKPEQLDVQNAYDHVLWNWSYATALGSTYADNIAKYYGLGSNYGNHLAEYKNQSTHNYVDDVLDSSAMWNHDLSISGGTQRTKYFVAVNYTDNDGSLLNSGFKRWNANFKLTQELAKNLKLDINARYSEMEFKGGRYEYATQSYQYRPIDNPLGTGVASDLGMGSQYAEDAYNPVNVLNDYENLRKVYRLSVNTGLTWNIIKGLVAKTEINLGRNWGENQFWAGGHTAGQSKSEAKLTNSNGYNTRWDTTLSYDVQGLGENHSLNVMVGNEVLGSRSNNAVIDGWGYPTEWNKEQIFGNMSMTSDKTQSTYTTKIGVPSHTISWFGRINYNLLGRYMLTATMRADGSSKFSKDNHWGYFPAAALAWRVSDEPFLESAKDWLDNLKFRVSFGTSGNDGIDASMFSTMWNASTDTNTGNITYKPASTLGNPDLKWETTTSRNIGLDYSFLNGKFNGSIEYYWNTTSDCLMLVPCDPTSGFAYQMQNVAKTSNKGIELGFNYNIIKSKDFNLSFGLSYNYNINKVEELAEGVNANAHTNWASTTRDPNYDYIVKVGEPVGLIQGYKSQGFYTVDDFNVVNGEWKLKEGVKDCTLGAYAGAANYKRPEGQSAFPGMAKYEDVDGNGIVDKNDYTIIGRVPAKHTGGFNFIANYKGWDATLNFAYQIGGCVYNANVMKDMYGDKDTALGRSRLAEVSDCWKMYDVNANGELFAVTNPQDLATLNAGAKHALNFNEAGIVSSEYVEDASFLRLQSLTVGYTLPKDLIKKLHISNARVYVTGSNLFCLKKYSGIDPDVNVSPSADSNYSGFPTPAYDYHAYPKTRAFTFGLNVAF